MATIPPDPTVHAAWNTYWAIWFILTFPIGFLIPEAIGLATDWHRTLSASVWDMERFIPDQHVSQWAAGHFLFSGVMFVLFIWLTGHFDFGWWRG